MDDFKSTEYTVEELRGEIPGLGEGFFKDKTGQLLFRHRKECGITMSWAVSRVKKKPGVKKPSDGKDTIWNSFSR